MPTVESLQVSHLVAFIVRLSGELLDALATAVADFAVIVTAAGSNGDAMANLTTGIFGTNSGLIYWINQKVFYLITNLPWGDLGTGLGELLRGIVN